MLFDERMSKLWISRKRVKLKKEKQGRGRDVKTDCECILILNSTALWVCGLGNTLENLAWGGLSDSLTVLWPQEFVSCNQLQLKMVKDLNVGNRGESPVPCVGARVVSQVRERLLSGERGGLEHSCAAALRAVYRASVSIVCQSWLGKPVWKDMLTLSVFWCNVEDQIHFYMQNSSLGRKLSKSCIPDEKMNTSEQTLENMQLPGILSDTG